MPPGPLPLWEFGKSSEHPAQYDYFESRETTVRPRSVSLIDPADG